MYFVSFILKNLTRRPVRTALTVLGLAVAVGSMIALLGISHNVEATIAEGFERRGVDLVVVKGGVTDQLNSFLDEKIADRVLKIPGVDPDGVDVTLLDLIEMQTPSGNSISVMMQGWPANYFGFDDLEILSGRRLHSGDTNKVMLGNVLAGNLNRKVGESVMLQNVSCEVVGIYKSFSFLENGFLILLLEEAQKLDDKKGLITGFAVRVQKSSSNHDADVEAVRQQILALKDDKGKPIRLSVQTVKEYLKNASHIKLTHGMVWMVSVISILVGIIGVLNTMIMSVLERTQEIGILRAMGWPKSRIVRMVFWEAIFLGLAAAAVGTLGAYGITYILTLFPKVNGFIAAKIAPIVIAEGFGLTLLIGLLGAVYPAIRAARLLPTEAIRHE